MALATASHCLWRVLDVIRPESRHHPANHQAEIPIAALDFWIFLNQTAGRWLWRRLPIAVGVSGCHPPRIHVQEGAEIPIAALDFWIFGFLDFWISMNQAAGRWLWLSSEEDSASGPRAHQLIHFNQ